MSATPVSLNPKDALSSNARAGRPRTDLRRRRGWRSAILGVLIGLAPLGAEAQQTEPLSPVPAVPTAPQAPPVPGQPTYAGETVAQRPRPEFDPLGMQIGDYFWFPRGEVDESFNSNIFATPNQTSDWITTLEPGFDLMSSFPRNALNLHAGAATQFFAINPSQNTATGFASADGRLDVDAQSAFTANAGIAHLYIPRTSPNSPGNASEPVTYNTYNTSFGYAQSGLRLGYQAQIAVQGTQYNAVPAFGGTILPQSQQDIVTPQAALQVSYEFIPDYKGYIRASGSYFDYTHTLLGSPSFNSEVYRADVGLQILPRHLIYGEFYVGYLTQTFNTAGLGSVTAPDAGGRLIWNVTGLTTLTFSGIRTFQSSNPGIGNTGNGYLDSSVTASVDHELRYNLLLNLAAGYENDNYQGISRNDNVFTAGASVRYLLSRNLYLGGTVAYQQRTSSGTDAGLPYSQTIATVQLSTQF